MTGFTPGDALPFPDDYDQPANSPEAFESLAEATQVALNKRANILPVVAAIALASNWRGAAQNIPTVIRYGELVVCRGYAHRVTALTVADNGTYPLGTVPAGWRPANIGRYPAAMKMRTTGGAITWTTSAVDIENDGTVNLVTNQAGSFAVDDWVSVSGLVWSTR